MQLGDQRVVGRTGRRGHLNLRIHDDAQRLAVQDLSVRDQRDRVSARKDVRPGVATAAASEATTTTAAAATTSTAGECDWTGSIRADVLRLVAGRRKRNRQAR